MAEHLDTLLNYLKVRHNLINIETVMRNHNFNRLLHGDIRHFVKVLTNIICSYYLRKVERVLLLLTICVVKMVHLNGWILAVRQILPNKTYVIINS